MRAFLIPAIATGAIQANSNLEDILKREYNAHTSHGILNTRFCESKNWNSVDDSLKPQCVNLTIKRKFKEHAVGFYWSPTAQELIKLVHFIDELQSHM